MKLPIVWTLKALRTYTALINFWQQAYPEQVVDGFYQQVEASLQRLSHMPHLYATAKHRPSVRRCIVNPNTVIYYRVTRHAVELLVFFDTRQDPAALNP
jgi:plasmid stabilization system protein ParE